LCGARLGPTWAPGSAIRIDARFWSIRLAQRGNGSARPGGGRRRVRLASLQRRMTRIASPWRARYAQLRAFSCWDQRGFAAVAGGRSAGRDDFGTGVAPARPCALSFVLSGAVADARCRGSGSQP